MKLQLVLLLCALGFIASVVCKDVQQRRFNRLSLKELLQEIEELQAKEESGSDTTDLSIYDDVKLRARREVELVRKRRGFLSSIKKAVNKIVDVAKDVVDKTKDAFKKAKDKAKKALKKVGKAFKVVGDFVVKGYKFTKDKLKKAFDKAKKAFEKLGDLVKGIDFDVVVNILIDLIDSSYTQALCISLCQSSVTAIFGSFTVVTAGITSVLAFLASSACAPLCEGALALIEDLVETAYND